MPLLPPYGIGKLGDVHEIPLFFVQRNIDGFHEFGGLAVQVDAARNVQVRHAKHDEVRIQPINHGGHVRVFRRMIADVFKQLVLALAGLLAAADNDARTSAQIIAGIKRGWIRGVVVLGQLVMQRVHEFGARRNGRRVPGRFRRFHATPLLSPLLSDFIVVASALRLHFTQVPRLVAAFALLVQLGHRRHAVKRDEHAAGRSQDGNAGVNAVANALQHFGLICCCVFGRVLHLTNHVVHHAIAVQVQIVDARQLGQPFDDAGVFFQHVGEITGDAHRKMQGN